jgi:hypothetical protein
MKAVVFLVVTSCSQSEAVKCGAGTVLKNGVCEVAPVAPATAAATPIVVPVDASIGFSDAAPAAPPEHWTYSEKVDQMRNGHVKFAQTVSTNEAQFGPPYNGGSKMAIIIRRGDRASGVGFESFAAIDRGQYHCGIDGCAVAIKFDDAPVETWPMHEGTNSQGIFFTSTPRLVSKLKSAKSVVVEAEFFREGKRQFTFDVSGLEFETPATPLPPAKPKTVREALGNAIE